MNYIKNDVIEFIIDKLRIEKLKTDFDSIVHYINDEDNEPKIEIWLARELMSILGYLRWENFQLVISKAVDSCKTQGVDVNDHFRDVTKMINIKEML